MDKQPSVREDYVRQVLEAYRTTPGTCGHLRRPDRLLAVQLYQRGVPLNKIENALVLAAVHRLIRPADLPALITTTGVPMCKPSLREVAQVAGLLRPLADEGESEILCDLAIVGAGPAGLSAAVNAASEGLQTVVLESFAPGGQAGSSSLIENFFGFPTGISGGELTNRAQLQAFRVGAKFSTPAQALSLAFSEGDHAAVLQIEGCNAKLRAKCVIIATGADYNRIDADGCASFEGRGVYYAATAIERQLCRKSTVIVAGGGNSAGQAAMFLSESTEKVLLVIRGADLSKSMSSYPRRPQASDPA
jgi:thioredoxin reductase (NADPH)